MGREPTGDFVLLAVSRCDARKPTTEAPLLRINNEPMQGGEPPIDSNRLDVRCLHQQVINGIRIGLDSQAQRSRKVGDYLLIVHLTQAHAIGHPGFDYMHSFEGDGSLAVELNHRTDCGENAGKGAEVGLDIV